MIMNTNSEIDIPIDSPLLKGKTQISTQREFVHPNGAIYLSWSKIFLQFQNFFSGNCIGYLMSREASIDIDDKFDFSVAKMLCDINNE